jgi:hypothetical protein
MVGILFASGRIPSASSWITGNAVLGRERHCEGAQDPRTVWDVGADL